ncbi:hypothetical protein RhiJN_10139 [Ceratobasidium sp. AG-Ba]|nr:hypothetical protein RhiJN_10139 [Ceratobasidium sp. AG-Ba]QRW10893.1 hypothetical protein RhiLY_09892 [Ceratobasidium sp. AG-Ba]
MGWFIWPPGRDAWTPNQWSDPHRSCWGIYIELVSQSRALSTRPVIAPCLSTGPCCRTIKRRCVHLHLTLRPFLDPVFVPESLSDRSTMHQPVVEPTPFRRSSFGIESSLRTASVSSDASQAFKEMLSRPDRPIPSRRSSLRGVPHTFVAPPPPPPMSMATQVVDPTTLSELLESTMSQATPICPSSPAVDMAHPSTTHRTHLSPVRSPPSTSPPPRANLSQAEHLLRSNPGFVPPPSASRRAYSFARDHPVRPPMAGLPQPRTPERAGSCPPDADVLKTRAMRSNSDGYTSASTSFMTECSGSPTSSISSQPSDSEDGLGQIHSSHDTKKAPKHYGPSFNLEVESRRLDLLWRETEKLWKDKHGNTLSRAEDMAFRQKVEAGLPQVEDNSPESEWRELWKSTSSTWAEFEARWRQEDAQKRAASRNDDGHFHTAHSESRDMTSTDDDKAMNTIMAAFEQRMNEKRRAMALKRMEEEQKRREQERVGGWPGTLGQTPEIDPLHRSHERLLRPDVMRTRSSSVVVEGRPVFHRARSGSIAAPTDVAPTAVPNSTVPESMPFETAPRFVEKPVRVKRGRPSHGSRESFDFIQHDEEAQRPPTHAEQHRAGELKQGYMAQARGQARRDDAQPIGEPHHDETLRADKSRRRDHERRSRELSESGIEPHRARDESSRPRETSATEARLPRVKSSDRVPQSTDTSAGSLEEEVLKLEREQAALARRIQELRAAAEAAAKNEAKPAPHEADRGRERERDQKPKVTEPKVKNEARKQQNEGGVFKAMQERLRKAEEHNKPSDFTRKAKRAATSPFLETETTPIASPEHRSTQVPPCDSEPSETRVHFSPEIPNPEQVRPSIPRVRTPGPKAPSRPRTPSPRSQSPVGHSSASSISIASNATRDTSPGHEAASSVHEVVAPEPAPKPQPSPTAYTASRPPVGRARDSGSSLSLGPERPKSTAPTPGPSLTVPHVNISTSPVDGAREQEPSPMNVKTPRASTFDPERTPRAPVCPVPEPSPKAEPSPPPRVYVSPNQARARAEEDGSKRRGDEEVNKRRTEDDSSKRRVDAAMGATVAAAAAEAFDRAGGKKRNKDSELQAQEDRRAAEELLAKERERRRQDDERRRQDDERRARERAEEARLREAAEKRDREERARMERERRERQEQEERKQRRWAEAQQYDRARPPVRSDVSVADAWNAYELRWSALSVASSTQPITFRNIPWPLLHVPAGPESITPQAVGAFLLSPLHSQDKSRKERLRTAMLRWHSDKFEGRWMARIDESERDKVKDAVGAVARSLTELMTKPDLY